MPRRSGDCAQAVDDLGSVLEMCMRGRSAGLRYGMVLVTATIVSAVACHSTHHGQTKTSEGGSSGDPSLAAGGDALGGAAASSSGAAGTEATGGAAGEAGSAGDGGRNAGRAGDGGSAGSDGAGSSGEGGSGGEVGSGGAGPPATLDGLKVSPGQLYYG